MKKNNRARALQLTQYILEEYWQRNLTPLQEHLHKKILWIGSMDEEYIHGAEGVLKRLKENNEAMPLVYLDQQEYCVIQNDGKTCIVVGRYRAFTKPESGMILSEKQRVTFVWERVMVNGTEELLIKHLHLSNTLHIQDEDERFPTRAGKENYEYVQRIMAERSLDEVVSVKDRNGVRHIVNYSDIMYIKADGNYVRIKMANNQESLRARKKFSDIMSIMPENFVKVSRSIGINRSYVKSVYGLEIIMIDGQKFKIPATACVPVKKAIIGEKSE